MPAKYTKFAAYFVKRRRALKLTQSQLANQLGVAKSSVFNWEVGNHRPEPEVLDRLAKLLAVPLADLYVAAGYTLPARVADVEPYLRARHPNMPDEAIAEAKAFFEDLESRYGSERGDGA